MKRQSQTRRVVVAFFRAPSGWIAIVSVAILVGLAIVAPIVLDRSANQSNFADLSAGASSAHLLGTDQLGRDVFARMLVATRLSLELGTAAAGLAFGIGVPLGAIVALLGHRARDAGRALINIFLSFPSLLLALIIVTIVGIGTDGAVIAVGIGSAPYFARLTESLASAAVGREYVACARVIGVKPRRLVFRYILPNVAEPIVIMGITYIAGAIIDVSALSFLGVGVQPPAYDWGALLNAGLQNFYPDPAGALGPAVMIALTVLAVNFLAEGLARALNPALWTAAKELRPGALRSRKLVSPQ